MEVRKQTTLAENPVLNVAIPWSLSNYIPLNGFHPLYRALFDHLPSNIVPHAWDNSLLFKSLKNADVCKQVVIEIQKLSNKNTENVDGTIEKEYAEFFYPPNQLLTEILTGDIEFHHTAPYPSLKRPFVFHCESFAPIFFPFSGQGSGDIVRKKALKEHYLNIFTNPLCLGIFSHIPETLENFRLFFNDPRINCKLFSSKIGLSFSETQCQNRLPRPCLSNPVFLFINSAHQDVRNFFHRGGHVALEFWKQFKANGRAGNLILRCIKPSDEDFAQHRVDIEFLRQENGKSIFWLNDYLLQNEHNALLAHAHFFLLPSKSLHSVSIMQAMVLGTVPIVTDTLGTDTYLSDGQNGIVLKGVRDAVWYTDPETGVLLDRYKLNPDLDMLLVKQLMLQIPNILDNPGAYDTIQKNAISHATQNFSGECFSADLWNKIKELHQHFLKSKYTLNSQTVKINAFDLNQAIICKEWSRFFESPPHPMRRINMIKHTVFELGGNFVHVPGNEGVALHYWSPLAQKIDINAPNITISNNLKGLEGLYLYKRILREELPQKGIKELLKNKLRAYPRAFQFIKEKYIFCKRYSQFIQYRNSAMSQTPDIQLIAENIEGYNVLRYFHRYYALLPLEGEFKISKVYRKEYASLYTALSEHKIMLKITSSRRIFGYVKHLTDMSTKNWMSKFIVDALLYMWDRLKIHTRPSAAKKRNTARLVLSGVKDSYDLFYYRHRYYAFPKNADWQTMDKIETSKCLLCFSGRTLKKTLRQIHDYDN